MPKIIELVLGYFYGQTMHHYELATGYIHVLLQARHLSLLYSSLGNQYGEVKAIMWSGLAYRLFMQTMQHLTRCLIQYSHVHSKVSGSYDSR